MSERRVCKFYLRGNCNYGSSCRFLHSDDRGPPMNVYHTDRYHPRYNNNQQYYHDSSWNDTHYDDRSYDKYEQSNYSRGKNNYYAKSNYNSRNYQSQNNDYEDYEEYNEKHYYESNENIRNKNYSKTNYRVKTENEHNYQSKNNQNNYQAHSNLNRHVDSGNYSNHRRINEQSQKEKMLNLYENEIKVYQTQMKQLLESNAWPFTCFHPIGHVYPIQAVNSLNLIEVSFEEIRCDYYLAKTMCADPNYVHKQVFDDLLFKARRQKEDIISFSDSVQDDMLATFQRCEESKTNPNFQNAIQVDPNSYWDMSTKRLSVINKAQMDSFSFSMNNTNKNSGSLLKIIMQTEIYGKMDCDAFSNETFTDYIPIMPPPKHQCL